MPVQDSWVCWNLDLRQVACWRLMCSILAHAGGPGRPRKIANPDYFLDEAPLTNLGSIGGVAIEIWTMDEGYLFSNVLIANDAAEAEQKRTSLWAPKKEAEVGIQPPQYTMPV